MKQINVKKLLLPNLPYVFIALYATKLGQAARLAPGADFSQKALHIMEGFATAFQSALPSFHPIDLCVGVAAALLIRLAVYVKGKNARKFRKNIEYGSARWGNAEDIKPYVDPTFANNVILTQTERLTMNSRPKDPKTARNKNVLVVGGSGSGKTRFFIKPNLMQLHSSYVVTDPKGSIVVECGKLLQRNQYKIKILNTINFKKSHHYNPFAYLHGEKDILKLVTTLIANTQGDGKSGDDFWRKAETLLYHFELDDIEHDPYVLISAVTALMGREWTISEVGGILDMLFEKQYILTETVTTETRYRTETRTGYYTDAEGNLHSYEYTVQVPYTYYICTVRLENFNLSHVPVYIMSQDQLSLYAMYMATLGNRPDLFGGSEYIGKYYTADYEKYEIPPEALEDAQFAAIIKEAEKYLGYPYVWGGSTPATSFDCSGFVSYVYNNCGVGWSFGRLGAEGLRQLCTRVSAANLRPGDLVFFQGTYDTTGASHVGIYVGNDMMLHCGDPIQYTSLNSSYWQSHFLAYGRLPAP